MKILKKNQIVIYANSNNAYDCWIFELSVQMIAITL